MSSLIFKCYISNQKKTENDLKTNIPNSLDIF